MPDSLQYKKVAIQDDILVNDVKVNGQSVVQNKIANITVTPAVADVTVDGTTVVDPNDHVAKITKDLKTQTGEFPLAFEDEDGNVAFAVTSEGHIKSKLFDSSDIHAGVEDVKLDGVSVVDANHIAQLTSPTIPVTDVQVDNQSVLQGTVAKIVQPLKTETGDPPFAIKDENDNTVLQVDSNGDIQTKNFDSSELSEAELKDIITASDIPNLDASKITTGQFADERISSASTWNAKQNAITSSNKLSADLLSEGSTNKLVSAAEKSTWNSKSTVSVNSTGTATDEVQYIIIDGVEKKLAGGSSGGGTVTQINTGIGLTGGPITTSGTISIDTTVVAQKSELATVATTGDYNDLINKPIAYVSNLPEATASSPIFIIMGERIFFKVNSNRAIAGEDTLCGESLCVSEG